jgi:hypothetical protein
MNTNGMKVDLVDMKEAMNDPNAEVMEESEASVDAIPDLEVLTKNLVDILEYLDKPEVKTICAKDDSVIRMSLINKYADSVPLKFIDLFMDKDPVHKAESVERTMRWIEQLAKAKAGTISLEEASQGLVNEVNNRYVYSKYGSKEAFEAALQKELISEQKKIAKSRSQGF